MGSARDLCGVIHTAYSIPISIRQRVHASGWHSVGVQNVVVSSRRNLSTAEEEPDANSCVGMNDQRRAGPSSRFIICVATFG